MTNELQNLKSLGGNNGIVSSPSGFKDESKLVVMEDVGVSLNRIVCSGNAGKLLACVVYRDIWCGALQVLKDRGMCHADIHEGNICVQVDGVLKAKVVDLESALPFTNKLRRIPIKNRVDRDEDRLHYETASEAWDRVSVCAILECLWEKDMSLADTKERTGHWARYWAKQRNSDEMPDIITEINNNKDQYLSAYASDEVDKGE